MFFFGPNFHIKLPNAASGHHKANLIKLPHRLAYTQRHNGNTSLSQALFFIKLQQNKPQQ